MARLTTSASDMVAAARARIDEVETHDLIASLDDPDLVVVDIGVQSVTPARRIFHMARPGWPGGICDTQPLTHRPAADRHYVAPRNR